MKVILEGDNAFPEMQHKTIRKGEISAVTALPHGMSGGRTSVAIVIELEDGTVAFGETSLRLFQQAAAAFKGRYGEE
jgi:hypothetical protein